MPMDPNYDFVVRKPHDAAKMITALQAEVEEYKTAMGLLATEIGDLKSEMEKAARSRLIYGIATTKERNNEPEDAPKPDPA